MEFCFLTLSITEGIVRLKDLQIDSVYKSLLPDIVEWLVILAPKRLESRGWSDGSVVKCASCSYREARFPGQQLHGRSYGLYVTLVPGNPVLYLDLVLASLCHTDTN